MYIFTGVPLPITPPSWLIKSSDWCCVPSLWLLCGGGGKSQGVLLEGDRQAWGFSLGMGGLAGGGPTGRDLDARPGRRAQASCLADSSATPTCSCYLCVSASPVAQPLSFRIYFLATQCPQLHFQVPPGLLGPALQNPVPRALPQAKGGPEEVTRYHTPKKGVGPAGWGPHRQLCQQPLCSSPSLPKAAGAPRLGSNLEGRGQLTKTMLTFFPGGAYSVT